MERSYTQQLDPKDEESAGVGVAYYMCPDGPFSGLVGLCRRVR